MFKMSNDELVSWAVRMALGNIGIVQTIEEYQKKGFASLVIKKMSKVIAAEDEHPVAFVPFGDEAAQLLFEKLGFQNEGLANTIELEKLDLRVESSFLDYDPDHEVEYEQTLRESAI